MATPTALFIDPPSHHLLGDRLFSLDSARLGGDDLMAPHIHLRSCLNDRGIPVRTADYLPSRPLAGQRNLYVSFGILSNYRALSRRADVTLSAFVGFECPIVEPRMYRALPDASRHFKRIVSWSDSTTLERFIGERLTLERFWWPQSFDDVREPYWSRRDRRLLVIINANKLPRLYDRELYTERLRAVEFFSRTNEIDLYGKDWDRPSLRLGRTWVPYTFKRVYLDFQRRMERFYVEPALVAARRAWRGITLSKTDTLSQYTFAICFENATLTGWITEKLFDCFFAGTVPVYWGAPDIAEFVPPECFIDMRRFSGYPELRMFLHDLGQAEVQRYRERARDFIRSPAFYPFSKQAFADRVWRFVEEDRG